MSRVLAFAPPDAGQTAALTDEFARIALLLGITARHRDGKGAGAEQKRELQALASRVADARREGFWADLLGLEAAPEGLVCDALAVALFPLAWPSRALVLTRLQPGIADPVPCQALLHELLMVGPEEELALHRILSPTGPLLAQNWLQVEGSGPARLIRPGPRLIRQVLGDEGFGTLPAGISLADDGTAPLPDLILATETEEALDEVAGLAAYNIARPEDRRPPGPFVLLTGPPGTGKSLAARHLSRRITRPLFQLNLGTIVSKWLGETERNLSRVFEQMSGTRGAILIDECDALLGKRVNVKEGRDHYVNLTVSHLLMLLERHRGPVWLTSNLRTNLDDAYIRRFSAVVEFRRPDAGLRRDLWAREIGADLPDVPRDELAGLAASVDLSAAEIAGACHYAKALAHAGKRPLSAQHLARAVRRERMKATITFTRNDLLALAPYLEDGL